MKRLFVVLSITVLLLSAISVSLAQKEDYPCYNTLPSQCKSCVSEKCMCRNVEGMCWCHDYCQCNGYPPYICNNVPVQCASCLTPCCVLEGFQWCQLFTPWYSPYWMEIYNNEVKGCYARDLVCYNGFEPLESTLNIEDNDCYIYEGYESLTRYNFGENGLFSVNGNGHKVPSLTLNVPICTNSRTFFQNPPPCTPAQAVPLVQETVTKLKSCCYDVRGCGDTPAIGCSVPCNGYEVPPNYTCSTNEIVILDVHSIDGTVSINGKVYEFNPDCNNYPSIYPGCMWWIVWYNGEKPFEEVPGIVYVNQGIPRTITIEGNGYMTFTLEQKCCYDCKEKPQLPSSILYPKVDIEQLSIAGGPTVIQDGKILSSLTISPGVQQAMVQVENRGFFTQNDSRVRFEGLPEGVTATVSPDSQKITAHNIGTYSATFTVGPNVPSGTYKVTIIAYSSNGVFDTITIDFVVP